MIQFSREVPVEWTLATLLDFVDGESDRVNETHKTPATYNEHAGIVVKYKGKERYIVVTANPKYLPSRED